MDGLGRHYFISKAYMDKWSSLQGEYSITQ